MVEAFLQAIGEILTFPAIFYALLGTALGFFFGVIPGLGGGIACALLISITFGWDDRLAFILLGSLFGGDTFGGSISAIMVNTPGTVSNAATVLDGYPLTRQGRSLEAVSISGIASATGSLIGIGLLLALIPLSRGLILAFSYPEMFMVTAIGISVIAVVTSGSMTKGLVTGMIGLLLSMVGRSPITGHVRFEFGTLYLSDGVPLIAIVIGMFAIAEALRLVITGRGGVVLTTAGLDRAPRGRLRERWSGLGAGVKPVFSNPRILGQSSVIGVITGIVPAVGGSVAGFISYAAAKSTVRDASRFGHGDERGLLAVEAANDAKDAGAVLPTIMFGLPGSPGFAVLLGALLLHGVNPGREMLTTRLDVTMILIAALLFASVASTAMGLLVAPWMTLVVKLPSRLITPAIYVAGLIGAYAARNRAQDMVVVAIAGIAGYVLKKNGFSLIPVVLGHVLGRTLETNFQQTLLSHGASGFVTRPISVGIMVVGLVGVGWSLWRTRRRRDPASPAAEAVADSGRAGWAGVLRRYDRQLLAIHAGLLALAATLGWVVRDLSPTTRIMPLILLVLLTGLVLLDVLSTVRTLRRPGGREPGEVLAVGAGAEVEPAVGLRAEALDAAVDAQAQLAEQDAGERETAVPGWYQYAHFGGFIGCTVLMYSLGYRWATPLFLTAFLAAMRVRLRVLVPVVLGYSAFVYVIFSELLRLR